MVKIWCEDCEGTGERHESHMTADKGICFVDGACKTCEGRGWNKPNGPTARAFIEAQIAECVENMGAGHNTQWNKGAIWMGKFALECLDKPTEETQ